MPVPELPPPEEEELVVAPKIDEYALTFPFASTARTRYL
jgi:hypothetical protein